MALSSSSAANTAAIQSLQQSIALLQSKLATMPATSAAPVVGAAPTAATTPVAAAPAAAAKPVLTTTPELAKLYMKNIDNNGNVGNGLTKGLGNSNAARNADIVLNYAIEFGMGARIGNKNSNAGALDTSAGTMAAQGSVDLNTPGGQFRAIAAAFKNQGGNYNNGKLDAFLKKNGAADLAGQGGVGNNDVQTLGAVAAALTRGDIHLFKTDANDTKGLFAKDANGKFQDPNDLIDNNNKYQNAIDYVIQGTFAKDVAALKSGTFKDVTGPGPQNSGNAGNAGNNKGNGGNAGNAGNNGGNAGNAGNSGGGNAGNAGNSGGGNAGNAGNDKGGNAGNNSGNTKGGNAGNALISSINNMTGAAKPASAATPAAATPAAATPATAKPATGLATTAATSTSTTDTSSIIRTLIALLTQLLNSLTGTTTPSTASAGAGGAGAAGAAGAGGAGAAGAGGAGAAGAAGAGGAGAAGAGGAGAAGAAAATPAAAAATPAAAAAAAGAGYDKSAADAAVFQVQPAVAAAAAVPAAAAAAGGY